MTVRLRRTVQSNWSVVNEQLSQVLDSVASLAQAQRMTVLTGSPDDVLQMKERVLLNHRVAEDAWAAQSEEHRRQKVVEDVSQMRNGLRATWMAMMKQPITPNVALLVEALASMCYLHGVVMQNHHIYMTAQVSLYAQQCYMTARDVFNEHFRPVYTETVFYAAHRGMTKLPVVPESGQRTLGLLMERARALPREGDPNTNERTLGWAARLRDAVMRAGTLQEALTNSQRVLTEVDALLLPVRAACETHMNARLERLKRAFFTAVWQCCKDTAAAELRVSMPYAVEADRLLAIFATHSSMQAGGHLLVTTYSSWVDALTMQYCNSIYKFLLSPELLRTVLKMKTVPQAPAAAGDDDNDEDDNDRDSERGDQHYNAPVFATAAAATAAAGGATPRFRDGSRLPKQFGASDPAPLLHPPAASVVMNTLPQPTLAPETRLA
jgi:hypothetical protein